MVVEDNVWIGANSIIVCGEKKGITIGTNSVIAAGSVVTKDVPPNILDGLSELLNLR
ncbi:DapH/DapD/GlmU-related protein, partial [Finegoldia magna]|uniref:DapH/DapD/GlmU-related protein n=2 Tax=Bacillota TaxID=1239 RepID=UPI003AF38324